VTDLTPERLATRRNADLTVLIPKADTWSVRTAVSREDSGTRHAGPARAHGRGRTTTRPTSKVGRRVSGG